MKVLGYIWKSIGGLFCLLSFLMSIVFFLFCDNGPMCSSENFPNIFRIEIFGSYIYGSEVYGYWCWGLASIIAYIFLFSQPIRARNLYRLDIVLYATIPFLFFTKDWFWWLLVAPSCTIFIAISTLITFLIQRRKRIKKSRPIPPQSEEIKEAIPLKQSTNKISNLLRAVLDRNTEDIKTVLATDPAQLNHPYAQNGNTPLHVAVWNGYKDIVELLLAQPGIDTQARNLAGKTALDLAKEKNFTEIIEMLKFTEQK